jgi:hypothetical protein
VQTVVELISVDLISFDEFFDRQTTQLESTETLEALSSQLLKVDVQLDSNGVDPVDDVIARPHLWMLTIPTAEIIRFCFDVDGVDETEAEKIVGVVRCNVHHSRLTVETVTDW